MALEQRLRFSDADVETWEREGICVLQNFFTPEECAAVRSDFDTVFGRADGAEEGLAKRKEGELGRFHPSQFKTLESIPLDCSPALNLIGLHPGLMAFARAALRTRAVQLYQCQAWAKFTGDADYDQPFHCDFVNHTLTVPSETPMKNSVTIFCYFTDVTDAHGATHYLTRSDSRRVAGPEATLNRDPEYQKSLQSELQKYARSSASPAGAAIAYTPDVYHRATNLTAPGGRRYAVMACYKASGDESIGFTAWPFHHVRPWENIFEHATPEQLACLGVQPPGDPFWTETTLARAQSRYPRWDLGPYRQGLVAHRSGAA
jgi:hypothetical protein